MELIIASFCWWLVITSTGAQFTQTCGENEEFYPCMPRPCPVQRVCSHLCRPGCACKEGYHLNSDGKCIEQNNGIICPNNLKFTTCGGCPRTCENLDKLIRCTLDCIKGCQCAAGLYYNNATQSCVSKDDCPKLDKDKNKECMDKDINSEYSTCGTCDPTCDDRNPICTKECKIGCFCVKGFVKQNGMCILPCNCPKEP